MNCFEATNDFVAFWQRKLAVERRTQFLAHLQQCDICNHSFRVFALTAPVLYSAAEPASIPQAGPPPAIYPIEMRKPSKAPAAASRFTRTVSGTMAACLIAAAAALALYFAAPPQMSFEDAIAGDSPNAETVSYPPADSFFARELLAQDATGQDFPDD